ncbi:MAG: type II secretion system F family protein [Candidatus Diapherotrites archaeon]|nr:type II secretion system F family protein [Candidatus Diapherotrites archaeon]
MGFKEIMAVYTEYLRQIRWPFKPVAWIGISFVMAAGVALVLAILFGLFSFIFPGFQLIAIHKVHSLLMSIISFLVVFDLMIGYPYLKATRRTDSIENNLPDALKQMADTLKAGGTFEYALRGISTSEYGPLTEEMNNVLRRLEEGENLENSLKGFSRNITSRVVTRAVNIILDSIAAGASLADILDEIADDVKANQRVINERKSSTLMQVLFMVSAGAFVSPFIFGLVISIVGFLMSNASVMLSSTTSGPCFEYCQGNSSMQLQCEKIQEPTLSCASSLCPTDYWQCLTDSLMLYVALYIIIEIVAIGLMIALVREGKITKSFIYIPILLLIAYIIFFVSNVLTQGFFGG